MCKHIRLQVHCCFHCSDTSTRNGICSMQQLSRQVSMHVMRLLDCVAPADQDRGNHLLAEQCPSGGGGCWLTCGLYMQVETGDPICWLSSANLVEVTPTFHIARYLPSIKDSKAPFTFALQAKP